MSNETNEVSHDLVAIRESFESTMGRTLNLSDELLQAILKRAGKAWDDFENADDPEKEACDFLAKAEAEAAKITVSDTGISVLVRKMDEEFHREVAECIAAVVKGKTTAIDMYAQFRRIYSKVELDSMPVPGTELEHVTGNQKPDKIKTKDQTGKPITVVWTNDFVSAMPEGKEFEGKLDDIAKEVKAPGSVAWLKAFTSKKDIAALKSEYTGKRNALRSMVKRAISLHHQWEAVQGMPLVSCEWIPGKQKERAISVPVAFGEGELKDATLVTKAPKPIWISPKGKPSDGRDFSITQFLAFDVALALKGENGGSMADLVATAGRGVGDGEGGEGEGDGVDMTGDVAQVTASQFYNWLNVREHQAEVLKKIANRAKDPEGNDWLDLVGSIYIALKPIYEKNKAAYEELQTKNAA